MLSEICSAARWQRFEELGDLTSVRNGRRESISASTISSRSMDTALFSHHPYEDQDA